jgi:3D (Asp-Asp-Asp) domain-containing protein
VAAAAACTSPPSPPVLQEIPLPEPVETCSVRELRVKATAYNSVPSQTDDTPNLTAFGTRLSPDTRAVAVSRDLEAKGLTHGARVCIDGQPGEWTVLDRTNRRLRERIDLHMGLDIDAAREWGVRSVTIRWLPPHRAAHCACDPVEMQE